MGAFHGARDRERERERSLATTAAEEPSVQSIHKLRACPQLSSASNTCSTGSQFGALLSGPTRTCAPLLASRAHNRPVMEHRCRSSGPSPRLPRVPDTGPHHRLKQGTAHNASLHARHTQRAGVYARFFLSRTWAWNRWPLQVPLPIPYRMTAASLCFAFTARTSDTARAHYVLRETRFGSMTYRSGGERDRAGRPVHDDSPDRSWTPAAGRHARSAPVGGASSAESRDSTVSLLRLLSPAAKPTIVSPRLHSLRLGNGREKCHSTVPID